MTSTQLSTRPGTPTGAPSTSAVLGLSFDTRDALLVATFWAGALGRDLEPGATTANAVVAPADIATSGPRLGFHSVPEGKVGKNRLHLDLVTADIGAETRRLVALGATRLSTTTNGARWVTFADPEGNEFDVMNPGY